MSSRRCRLRPSYTNLVSWPPRELRFSRERLLHKPVANIAGIRYLYSKSIFSRPSQKLGVRPLRSIIPKATPSQSLVRIRFIHNFKASVMASPQSSIKSAQDQDPDVTRILHFWFSLSPPQWFQSSPTLDSQLQTSFSHLVTSARSGALSHWATNSPQSTLALLLLLDQFPRNLFRGTPAAFASDPQALSIATSAIAKGWDRHCGKLQQTFFHLPLMHHEDLISQVACVALAEGLVARWDTEGDEEMVFLRNEVKAAREHMGIIARFGRFPHRNVILGRESTEAEKEYLKETPSGFSGA